MAMEYIHFENGNSNKIQGARVQIHSLIVPMEIWALIKYKNVILPV